MAIKEVKYLSPSSIAAWENLENFVKWYMVYPPLPRAEQSNAMALGSSFDAFVKNELSRCIYGGGSVKLGETYHLETLFKKQVNNPDDQSWAWEEGGYLFLKYKDHGAFDDLLIDMEGCTELIFEESILKNITMPDGTVVPIKGIPDCSYRHRNGKLVILDWKCNNFRSSRKISPQKNYIIERPDGRSHNNVTPRDIDGIFMQDEYCFSDTNDKWAAQLAIYGWLRGQEIGSSFIGQIDQILCEPGETKPESRSVTYRSFITPEYQFMLADRITKIWKTIQSGHIFLNLSREESDAKMVALSRYNEMANSGNPIMDIIKGIK